jgi:formylglycine-generating enzyme required for sulfatase activity
VPGVKDKDGNEIARKMKDEWRANKVPTGKHTATFRALNKTFTHTFAVEEGQTTHLFVNILTGKVRDVEAEQATQTRVVVAEREKTRQEAVARRAELAGQARTIPGLGLMLMPIAAGIFTMGSENGDTDEKPITRVTLTQPYWLGNTEVTQGQWLAVMGSKPSSFKGGSLPVEQVSWDDAMQFCQRLTERERSAGRLPNGYAYTLPTEAQWEFACRAGTVGDYAGELDAMAWYEQNSGSTTHAVGTKEENAWGLSDMHGNVWEWCADWYGNYAGGSVRDPQGADSGSRRVCRGGGWWNSADRCRSALRVSYSPDRRAYSLGFRLALSSVR